LHSILLARSAENIFWLARYIERAENLARILDVLLRFLATAAVQEIGCRFYSLMTMRHVSFRNMQLRRPTWFYVFT
jgi:uncharacterized alpha-E superfamily protein